MRPVEGLARGHAAARRWGSGSASDTQGWLLTTGSSASLRPAAGHGPPLASSSQPVTGPGNIQPARRRYWISVWNGPSSGPSSSSLRRRGKGSSETCSHLPRGVWAQAGLYATPLGDRPPATAATPAPPLKTRKRGARQS